MPPLQRRLRVGDVVSVGCWRYGEQYATGKHGSAAWNARTKENFRDEGTISGRVGDKWEVTFSDDATKHTYDKRGAVWQHYTLASTAISGDVPPSSYRNDCRMCSSKHTSACRRLGLPSAQVCLFPMQVPAAPRPIELLGSGRMNSAKVWRGLCHAIHPKPAGWTAYASILRAQATRCAPATTRSPHTPLH